jgi:RNA polymerase sigma-70 factor, ECF subfamily
MRASGRAPLSETTQVADPLREDYQFARRLVTGDAAAWRTLVERFGRLVLARVLAASRELNRPMSQSDAEDLCAEVFSGLVADNYAALRRFEGRSTLSTWLCVVTRRMVLRRLVSAGREPSQPAAHPPPLESLVGPTADGPLAGLIGAEDRALLAAGIQQLGERHRRIARLFYVEGRSYREISQQLNMPVNSIGPTLARIHEKLRAAMKHEEP